MTDFRTRGLEAALGKILADGQPRGSLQQKHRFLKILQLHTPQPQGQGLLTSCLLNKGWGEGVGVGGTWEEEEAQARTGKGGGHGKEGAGHKLPDGPQVRRLLTPDPRLVVPRGSKRKPPPGVGRVPSTLGQP